MTREELEEMTFEEQMQWTYDNVNDVTTEDELINQSIVLIENGDLMFALHILNAIYNNPYNTEYYRYDYSMGTLETPTPIIDLEDIEDLIDFEKDE